jgi:predicted DNA-binding transcriptional regulator AlpA
VRSNTDRPLTVEETCALCGISRATFDRYVRLGRGPQRYRVDGRSYRIMLSEARRWNRARFERPAVAYDQVAPTAV